MRHAFGYRAFPENASQAEIIAHKHDEPDVSDWVFRRNIFEGLPHRYAIPVAFQYNAIHESKGRREANLYLLDVRDDLHQQSIKLSANDDELIDFAKQLASECRYYRSQFQTPKRTLIAVTAYIKRRHKIDVTSRFNKLFTTDSYQEPKGFKIHGVETGNVTVLTRLHKWTIRTISLNESKNNQWKPRAIEHEQGVFEKIRASGP